MNEFKETVGDIVRPFVMLFTLIYLILICRPFLLFAENLLWVFILEDWFFMGWWIVMLLCFCIVIIATWMLIMSKIGLWK